MNSRRNFLKYSSVAAAGATFPLHPLLAQTAASNSRVLGANDRIHVALIGCGGMGSLDLRDCLRIRNVECAALCDVDESHGARAAKDVFDRTSRRPALVATDFRRLLDLKDLDAVIVATPDHWHALPTIMACQAGKDVYVEKPLAACIAEGRAMVEAARKYNRVVQMGTQQRSADHYRAAIDYVMSGKLGKIHLVRTWTYVGTFSAVPVIPDSDPPAGVDYDMWLGPAPKRPFNQNRFHGKFRRFWDYSGGVLTDWGAHMIDIACWGMGFKPPTAAVSMGGKFGYPDSAMETPDIQQVLWELPGFSLIWEHGMGIGRGPEAREHGVAFHGVNGVLVVDRAGWEVYPEIRYKGGMQEFRMSGVPRQLARGDCHLQHLQNFIDCVRSRERPRSDVEIGHYSTLPCHLGNIAYRLRRRVNFDGETETIINDPEAQKYVSREYRAPWKLVV